MVSILLRALGVVAVIVAVGVVLWAPWRTTADGPATVENADAPVEAAGRPVDDSGLNAPHTLVRYDMPAPAESPALGADVTPLDWADLWKDGEFSLKVADEERVGRPTAAEFPVGTTAEDVMLFFLDIGDLRSMQPLVGAVRPELDGKRVRIAGYTTPVGFAENETRFLLVPELGACIHVPPPPPNQIVYVEKADGAPEMFEPVWVTGTLKAEPVATVLADVGYRLVDAVAEPYR